MSSGIKMKIVLLIVSLLFTTSSMFAKSNILIGYEGSNGIGTTVYDQNEDNNGTVSTQIKLFKVGFITSSTYLALRTGKAEMILINDYESFTMKNIQLNGVECFLKLNGNENLGIGLRAGLDYYTYKFESSDVTFFGQSKWKGKSYFSGLHYYINGKNFLATVGIDNRKTVWDALNNTNDSRIFLKKDNEFSGVFSISFLF